MVKWRCHPSGPGKVKTPRPEQPTLQQRRVPGASRRRARRALPPDYDDGCAIHRRFSRWRRDETWAKLLDAVPDDPDLEWLMIDGSYVKAHQRGADAVGDNQEVGLTKGELIGGVDTKLHTSHTGGRVRRAGSGAQGGAGDKRAYNRVGAGAPAGCLISIAA